MPNVAYYICAVSGRFPENYQIGLRARTWGVVDTYEDRIRRVQPGDKLFFFVGGSFRSLHEITQGYYYDRTPLWPEMNGSPFPHRIGISDPVAVGDAPLAEVAPHISFMRDLQVPAGTLQGGNGVFNNRLTDADAQYLQSRLSAAVPARAHVAPAVAQQIAERHAAIFRLYEHDLGEQIIQLLTDAGMRVPADGRRVPTGVDVIDAIGVDPQNRLVVVDINRGRAPDDALLQVLRHMSWVRQNRADRRDVRGLIVAEEADRALLQLVHEVPNVDLQLFRLTLELLPPPTLPPRAAAC